MEPVNAPLSSMIAFLALTRRNETPANSTTSQFGTEVLSQPAPHVNTLEILDQTIFYHRDPL